jgi:hypothetical protein
MARDLTPDVARHDDATSEHHARDKREKMARELTEYTATPALIRPAGSGIVDGFTHPGPAGITFKMDGGKPQRVKDSAAYTREAIAMAKERAHYYRLREREDGSTRKEFGKYKTGAVSLLITVTPWAVATIGRLKPEARENLMLHLAAVQAERIKEVSGRDTWGGAIHWDTAVPHVNLHIPKTAPGQDGKPGMAHPKSKFKTAGSWTTGADRIARKFPGLLSTQQAELLAGNLARKDEAHLIDVQASRATDLAFESWIKQAGLWNKYVADCDEYARRKKRQQEAEKHRRLMAAALSHWHQNGIWPLAFSAMRFAAWRMLPREMRGPIMLAIRAQQFIRRPISTGIKAAVRAMESRPQVMEMEPHPRQRLAAGMTL